MATYSKNKNIITIGLEGSTGVYTLDIETGVLYGIKGSPIKTCPRKREMVDFLRRGEPNNLQYAIYHMFDMCSSTSQYPHYLKRLSNADKLDSLGIPNHYYSDYMLEELCKDLKKLSAYFKDHPNFDYSEYIEWRNFEQVRKELGSIAEQLTPHMYHTIKNYIPNPTKETLTVCAYYLTRGKYWEYHNGNLTNLAKYLEMCAVMDKEPQKVNNFMREFIETKQTYELRKKEFDDRRLAVSYAKYSKAWEFAYGDYVVSIPKTAKDIIDEGDNMHHCVASYVNQVLDGGTYICFIRHKDTPDKCYITCQVTLQGRINQYYLAYDRLISKQEDIDFRNAFAEHLKGVWGN